jgi:hypothetical protein
MSSKAKSGMSAVRQYTEQIRQLTPPNTFVPGATSFTGPIRDGKGHSAIHVGVSNNTPFTVNILQAWRTTGPFVMVVSQSAALDPISGLYTVEIECPIVRKYVQVTVDVPAPGLGADFEIGGYFLPRADSPLLVSSGGNPPAPPTPAPGNTITTPADTPVGTGATVPLPAIPSGVRKMTVQNTGPAGTWIRVREVGGTAGAGKLMPRLGEYTYGGSDGAIAQLEVEDVSLAVGGVAVATTVCVQYERN